MFQNLHSTPTHRIRMCAATYSLDRNRNCQMSDPVTMSCTQLPSPNFRMFDPLHYDPGNRVRIRPITSDRRHELQDPVQKARYQILPTASPTPYNLHPAPYTIYTLHPTPYTLHPTPCALHHLHPTLYTIYTLHPTPYTLRPTPYTIYTLGHNPPPPNLNSKTLNSKLQTLSSKLQTLNQAIHARRCFQVYGVV